MGLAIDDIGSELQEIAAKLLGSTEVRSATRASLESTDPTLPPFWHKIASLGWLGLHIEERYGGQGAGIPELAVVVEQFASQMAPGPFLPSVIASTLLAETGTEEAKDTFLPRLSAGYLVGALALSGNLRRQGNRLSGKCGVVIGADLADLLAVVVGEDILFVERNAPGVSVTPVRSIDSTHPAARVSLHEVVIQERYMAPAAKRVATRIARALASAEAAGITSACSEMAVGYAKQREQFGRTIATFQAIKHHCANMLVEAEIAAAVAWDASLALGEGGAEADLSAAVAASLALPGALRCAKLNTQVHGGIGYTWEHDAHLYVRRAQALQAAYGPISSAQEDTARLTRAGVERRLRVLLPKRAEEVRHGLRELGDRIRWLPPADRLNALVESGYAFPHWPKPWGRGADAVEQIVAEQELADLPHPNLGIGGWITQTLATHGTPTQQDRWIRQSQLGEIAWCQLFSEPNAGSDAAGIQTKGIRTDGGWLVQGQKVWTSGADHSSHGFATVRTNPDSPKHAGITTMVIDMSATGVQIRPLREMTGETQFSEVFLDQVFVPDDDVVGPVDGGWAVARTTLGNERVSIGAGIGGADASQLVELLSEVAPRDVGYSRHLATLLAQNQALKLLNLRSVSRSVSGSGPGPEGNVTKLLAAEHAQAVNEFALLLLGSETLATDGVAGERIHSFFSSRQNTIAGGTSEITRNQIAERILRMPRDPLIR